jgi:hypothetical protein
MRYSKINKYILTIELLDDSTNNENRSHIIDKYYAKYTTNKYKILEIENMVTNEILTNIFSHKVGDIVNKNIYYFFSKDRAFFELDYNFYIESYQPVDRLYYLYFFDEHNKKYVGLHKVWYDNGNLELLFFHLHGEILG